MSDDFKVGKVEFGPAVKRDTIITGKYGEVVRIERKDTQAEKCSRGEHEAHDPDTWYWSSDSECKPAVMCKHCRCLYVESSE